MCRFRKPNSKALKAALEAFKANPTPDNARAVQEIFTAHVGKDVLAQFGMDDPDLIADVLISARLG